MNPTTAVTSEVRSLIEAVCDGMADDTQVRDLESLLLTDEETCKFYVYLLDLDAKLQWLIGSLQEGNAVFKEFIAAKQTPQQPAVPTTVLGPTALHTTFGYFSSGWLVSYSIATVIMGIGALIAGFTYVSRPREVAWDSAHIRTSNPQSLIPNPSPKAPFVGHITGMVDCKWDDSNTKANCGAFVPLGRKYALSSGLMEITYDTGAKVILQGPVTYEVESAAGGFLSVGKLTARLEKKTKEKCEISSPQSPIPNPSFAVRTPTAIVTDLGTEFGVEVSKEGNTTSHVFRGSVRLDVAAGEGKMEGESQILHERQWARVERSGDNRIRIIASSTKPIGFVREIAKPTIKTLDLADVVAGGDGFSGRRNWGIDARDGRRTNAQPETSRVPGDEKYHRVEGMPFVDGVFIPYGAGGPVQLDSAGHSFADFLSTENNTSGLVFGGKEDLNGSELSGVDYASPGHSMIAMPANKGITFDLEAIRRANPDWKLLRFRAVAGNAEAAPENGQAAYADLWVFVDGQMRFKRRQVNRYNGAMPVVVPITDKDHFLTLATTDGGNGIWWDHTMFGDPRIEMAPAKAVDRPTPQREATEH